MSPILSESVFLDYLRGFRPIPHENVFEIADLFLADVGEIA